MLVNSTGSSDRSVQSPALQVEDVRQTLSDLICSKIQAICADNKRRLEGFKNDVSLLSGGIFYPEEYFHALKEAGLEDRIEELRNLDAFFYGYAPSESFELLDVAQRTSGCGLFVLNKGVLPSVALDKMAQGLTLMECRGVCDLVRYLAIKEVLGNEKFDLLFSSDSPFPLTIGFATWKDPLNFLVEWIKADIPDPQTIQRGDLVYFRNSPNYRLTHPYGMAQGFNTFCIDETISTQKFAALGLESQGLNPKQIFITLLDELNRTKDTDLEHILEKTKEAFNRALYIASLTSHAPVQSEPSDRHVTWAEFSSINSKNWSLRCRLDVEKITALANSTVEEAKSLFQTYWIQNN